jgi:hypothetical protein
MFEIATHTPMVDAKLFGRNITVKAFVKEVSASDFFTCLLWYSTDQ